MNYSVFMSVEILPALVGVFAILLITIAHVLTERRPSRVVLPFTDDIESQKIAERHNLARARRDRQVKVEYFLCVRFIVGHVVFTIMALGLGTVLS